MQRAILCLVGVMLCVANCIAQVRHDVRSGQKPVTNRPKSAIAILMPSPLGGSHSGEYNLKVDGRGRSFHWDRETRFYNFETNSPSWDDGAEWRIIYSEPSNVGDDRVPYLRSVTYMGNRPSPPNRADNQNLSRIKVSYYRNNSDSWSYTVGEGNSEVNLSFNLSTDGIGNKPFYRVGQQYYEVEIHTLRHQAYKVAQQFRVAQKGSYTNQG
jgi:hypothetical protein